MSGDDSNSSNQEGKKLSLEGKTNFKFYRDSPIHRKSQYTCICCGLIFCFGLIFF